MISGNKAQLNRITQEVADLRAELVVTQNALALVTALLARLSPNPAATGAHVTATYTGLSVVAGRAVARVGRPVVVTGAEHRFTAHLRGLVQPRVWLERHGRDRRTLAVVRDRAGRDLAPVMIRERLETGAESIALRIEANS